MPKCKPLLLKVSKKEKQEEKYYQKIVNKVRLRKYGFWDLELERIVPILYPCCQYVEVTKFGCKRKKVTLKIFSRTNWSVIGG